MSPKHVAVGFRSTYRKKRSLTAFHRSSEAEFEAIFGRVKAKGTCLRQWAIQPHRRPDHTRRGGRGLHFEDLNGHLLEVMTVRETGELKMTA